MGSQKGRPSPRNEILSSAPPCLLQSYCWKMCVRDIWVWPSFDCKSFCVSFIDRTSVRKTTPGCAPTSPGSCRRLEKKLSQKTGQVFYYITRVVAILDFEYRVLEETRDSKGACDYNKHTHTHTNLFKGRLFRCRFITIYGTLFHRVSQPIILN